MIQQIIFTASVILLVIGGPLSPRAEQRGERWTGISTVGTEDCDALTLDVRIMDGRISGGATSKPSGRSEARRAWVVSGTVSPMEASRCGPRLTMRRYEVSSDDSRFSGSEGWLTPR